MGGKDVVLVTGSDLAEQAMVMLQGFEVVFAGRQPTEDELIALCERHNPVAISGTLRQDYRESHGCRPSPAGYFQARKRDRCDRPDGSGPSATSPSALRQVQTRRQWLNIPGRRSSPAQSRWYLWTSACETGTGIRQRINPLNWRA